MTRPVVVTGVGLSTSLGPDAASNWTNLCHPPAEAHERPHPSFQSSLDQAQALADASTREAFRQAELQDFSALGCTFSASKPLSHDGAFVAPDLVQRALRHQWKMRGEARNVIAACATGAYSIAVAASWIAEGLCDVVLAGSVEPAPHPLIEAGFRQMGVVSEEGIMRPFDKRRDGFCFGEGAGAIVLESLAHARARGKRPLARLSGWAMGADAHSAVAFNSNGQRIAAVIQKALKRAALAPASVQHVNAHGTATRLNDWLETQALRHAFGSHAERLLISATKGSTGHLLGAAGSVEFVLTLLALQHQMAPPTAYLEEADPTCSLDYVPKIAREATLQHAISLSFGFGGPIGALVVSQD